METDTKEIHRKYWNDEKNTVDYEKNNFSIFEDPKARKFILERLDKVLHDPSFIVSDLGCGPGHILPYLSGKCKEVIKIDYAENMLKEAHRRNKNLKNITYSWGDMRNMKKWYDSFDVAISTNSILPGSITEAEQMTAEIYKSLKEDGIFFAVMPSIETSNYLARLRFDRMRQEGLSEKEAIEKIKGKYEKENKFDGLFGFMKDGEDSPVQKYFYRDEIEYLFKKIGLKIKTIEKLCYGWEHCKKHNYDYFPGEAEIYDWLVIAEK